MPPRALSTPADIIGRIREGGVDGSERGRATLRGVAADVLVEVVESTEPWWVRRAALGGLEGRVDRATGARLLARALDPAEDGAVRRLVVDALGAADRRECADALVALLARPEVAATYGLEEALVGACAALGDLRVLRPALALAYDPWSHRRRVGEAAAAALLARVGDDGCARALGVNGAPIEARPGDATPDVVRFAIDRGWLARGAVLQLLGDPDPRVREGALARLGAATDEDLDDVLDALARDAARPAPARAHAILLLQMRGDPTRAAARFAELPDRHVALPGVPTAVRRAVLHHYLPGARGTDVRLILEGMFDLGIDLAAVRDDGPDESPDAILDAARAAFATAGQRVGAATPIGAVRQQGGGTYAHLDVDGATILVSTLGRFVGSDETIAPAAGAALTAAGFLIIDDALARTVFEGLGVYFFGRREPLRIHDLLFYWQD